MNIVKYKFSLQKYIMTGGSRLSRVQTDINWVQWRNNSVQTAPTGFKPLQYNFSRGKVQNKNNPYDGCPRKE